MHATFCRTEPYAVCAVPYSSGSSIQNGWQNTCKPECLHGKCLSSVPSHRADFKLRTDFITSFVDLCLFYLRKMLKMRKSYLYFFLLNQFSLALYIYPKIFYPFEGLLARGNKLHSRSYLHVSNLPKMHISINYTAAAPLKYLCAIHCKIMMWERRQ